MAEMIRRNPRAVFRRLEPGAGGVLLDLESGEYRRVNETGALIIELLDPGRTFDELLAGVRAAVNDPPEDLEAQVRAYLSALDARDVIQRETAPS